MEGARSRPWSDLQPELLGLVVKGLPSLADRVRLRAVCHPWRSNSMLQPPPLPFPWITLPNGTFLSMPAGEIHRLPVPADTCCQSSIDNWLLLVHSDGVCSLMNVFSKAALELPELAKLWKREIGRQFLNRFPEPLSYKLAVPSALDSSPDPLVATVIIDSFNCSTLCISQLPTVTYSFRGGKESLPHLSGVAFLDGNLYTLSECWKLLTLEFCKDFGSYPNIKCVINTDGFCQEQEPPKCLLGGRTYSLCQYLVECGGKLLMVERFIDPVASRTNGREVFDEHAKTVAFGILEADLHSKPARWRVASDLGGHALFLGKHSSKSLPAEECSGSQEDCIYFMCDYPPPESSANPLRDAGIYNTRNSTITPLHPRTTAEVPPCTAGQWRPTWFFPPGAV